MKKLSHKQYILLGIACALLFTGVYFFLGFGFPGFFRHSPEQASGFSLFVWNYGSLMFGIVYAFSAYLGTMRLPNNFSRWFIVVLVFLLGYSILNFYLMLFFILGCMLFGCAL